MRTKLVMLAFSAIVGCGTIDTVGTDDQKTTPSLNVVTGQFQQVDVGNVVFTILRHNTASGEISARNNNANRARIRVEREDKSGLIIDKVALATGEETDKTPIGLLSGTEYRFTVQTWKDDIVDFIGSCRYSDGNWKPECFVTSEEKVITIQ